MTTPHDRKRLKKLVQRLEQVKEEAHTALLYLSEENRDAVWDTNLVIEHLEVALEHLRGKPYLED